MKFIAMNRFKIVLGYENDLESIWKNRGNSFGWSARV
jgi:hypothetical protein